MLLFLCNFWLDQISFVPFDFGPQKRDKKGSAQRVLGSLRAFELTRGKVCDSHKLF